MRIALVQFESAPGLFLSNLERHIGWAQSAREQGVDWIAFPELSLTGYNPTLVREAAIELSDSRLDPLQDASDRLGLSIICGAPLKKTRGIQIGCLIFRPHARRLSYSKMYLHQDEVPFFVPGEEYNGYIESVRLGLGICYELSVETHRTQVMSYGPLDYLACVAKTSRGIPAALQHLSAMAKEYSIRVMMVNGVGISEEGPLGGQTSVWAPDGKLEQSLDDHQEGLLISDL